MSLQGPGVGGLGTCPVLSCPHRLLTDHPQERKKEQLEEERRDQALQAKASLDIPLLPETDADRRLAALLTLHTLDSA